MAGLPDMPFLLFIAALLAQWLAAIGGARVRVVLGDLREGREDYAVILAATLTLLGLVVGFSFSMAVNRYDLRKANEASEANAIGTQYLRADLLPVESDAARLRALLRDYVDVRIAYYRERDPAALRAIIARRRAIQAEMWAVTRAVAALVVAGTNEVINTQGYTEAAWGNRIPGPAWALMGIVAVISNALIGFGTRAPRPHHATLSILPLIMSIALFLIADIDSPRGGIISVSPRDLLMLSASWSGR